MFGLTNIADQRGLQRLDPVRKLVCMALLISAGHNGTRVRFRRSSVGWDVAIQLGDAWHLLGDPVDFPIELGRAVRRLTCRGVLRWLLGREAIGRLWFGGATVLTFYVEMLDEDEVRLAFTANNAVQRCAITLIREYTICRGVAVGSPLDPR